MRGGYRHCGRERGLTLVEVLITIIVAGLFFAAMVPVFVGATQQSSNDRARILATNTVQSAIERLRDMPYDQLWDTTWTDATAKQAALGQDIAWKGSGSTLDVTVETYPAGVLKGQEKYLLAAVTANWTGKGGLHHKVSMKTAIYRQGLATETLVLLVSPLFNGFIKGPVTVSAQVNAADGAKLDHIDFTVYANNGTQVEAWRVYTQAGTEVASKPAGSSTWSYNHLWKAVDLDGNPLADGRYTFIAKTVPIQPPNPGDPVPPAEWARKEYILDRAVPGKPSLDVCKAGFYKASPTAAPQPFVYLAWQLDPNISDVDHFEIGRTGTKADGSALPEKIISLPKWALEYVDRDVVSEASYSYKVLAQDTQEQRGPWSDPKTVALSAAGSDLVPLPPAGPVTYKLTNPGVTVEWGASQNASDVDAYRVYRQGADGVRLLVGSLPVQLASTATRFSMDDISAEYGQTYTYFVTAVSTERSGLQWESASVSGAPVHVPEPPMVGMTVDVQVEPGVQAPSSARLMIHSLDSGDIIPANPWDYPEIKPGSNNTNQNTWTTGNILYPGTYEVIAVFYGQGNTLLGSSTSETILVSSPATAVHVPYSGPN